MKKLRITEKHFPGGAPMPSGGFDLGFQAWETKPDKDKVVPRVGFAFFGKKKSASPKKFCVPDFLGKRARGGMEKMELFGGPETIPQAKGSGRVGVVGQVMGQKPGAESAQVTKNFCTD